MSYFYDIGGKMSEFIVVQGGLIAMTREPSQEVSEGTRVATDAELLLALGSTAYPWGDTPQPEDPSWLWIEHRIGETGFKHEHWFRSNSGRRWGGAKTVTTQQPGALRHSLWLDGGAGRKNKIEGYALIIDLSEDEQRFYRRFMAYCLRGPMADGGRIIYTLPDKRGIRKLGFVGRCQDCPMWPYATKPQIKKQFPDQQFELFPEWQQKI